MENQLEKRSYALGYQVGSDLLNQNIEVDMKYFFKAIEDAYNKIDSELSNEEAKQTLEALHQEINQKAAKAAQEIGNQNMQEGLKYLEDNKNKEGVKVTESGLQYKVISSGEGKSPAQESTVEVHYEGKLIDGNIFDSSYKRGQSAVFPINRVIAGWTEALQLMKEGDTWELTIPSALAYGSQGAGDVIPPNAPLIFKVELIKVM